MSLSVLPYACSQPRVDSFQVLIGLLVTLHTNMSSFIRNLGLKDGTKTLTAVCLFSTSIHGYSADVVLGTLAISYCWVFMTLESAEAYRILFCKIFTIVAQDTGVPLQFFYIHGRGIEVITADEGKGQVLGTIWALYHILILY